MSGRTVALSIITPAELFYSGIVDFVRVTTLDGEEGFKAGRAWCVKLLAGAGHVRLRESGDAAGEHSAGSGGYRIAALKGGHIDVKDQFVIYAEDAAWVEAIDL